MIKEAISEEEKEWIIPKEVRPADVYANPKAHRKDLPYRYIISAKGSATENLARWTEIKLKKFPECISISERHHTFP